MIRWDSSCDSEYANKQMCHDTSKEQMTKSQHFRKQKMKYLNSVKIPVIGKSKNIKCWQGHGGKENLYMYQWTYVSVQALWKHV